MQVTRAQGIALFKALGYNATDAWTDERLAAKLNALPKLDTKSKVVKDKTLARLLKDVLEAKDEEADIEVTAEKKGKTPIKNTAPAKKGKPAPEEDDDDEDTEEEEDEEGDDDSDDESDDDEDSDDGDDDEEESEDEDDDEEEEDAEDDAPALKVGDTVDHEEFGTCTVKKLGKDGKTAIIEDADGDTHKGVAVKDLIAVDDTEEEEESDDEEEDEDDDSGEETDEDESDDDEESEDSEDEEDEDETTDEEDDDMADETTAVAAKPKTNGKKASGKPAAPAAKGGKKADAKPGAGKGGKKFASAGGEGKPGVIASIAELVSAATADKPISKKAILEKLIKRFPERTEEAMKQTLNIQLPTRLRSEKGLDIQKNENGYYVGKGSKKAKK